MRWGGRSGLVVAALCIGAAMPALGAGEPTQGVSRSEVVLGSIQDLSGPLAPSARQLVNGMNMRADELNRQGGINGRRIRLIVLDSGGDVKRAAADAEKLSVDDHVFAVLGQIGAATNVASMPSESAHNVINFLPVTGARDVYDPPSRLKVAFWPSYQAQVRAGVDYLTQQHHAQRPCILYQDDEYGAEVLRSTELALRQLGLSLHERIALRRDDEVPKAVERLHAVNCELIVLGTPPNVATVAMAAAHRANFEPDFLGTSALYGALAGTTTSRAADGLYAVHTVSQPYRDDASKLVRDWAADYNRRFGEDPSVFAVYGYYIMDLFTKAAAKAGPKLNLDTFEAALENTTFPRDMFGSPEFHVTASERLGGRKVRISQVISGRWVPVTTLLDTPVGPTSLAR